MEEQQHENMQKSQGSDGFDRLAQQARVDSRMSRTKDYTPEQRQALLADLLAYRMKTGRSWKQIAAETNIAESTLSEIRAGRYKGDMAKYLRVIDEFMARVRLAEGRPNLKAYASTRVSTRIYGVFRAVLAYHSIGVAVGPSGCGKSITLRAITADHEGTVYVRLDEGNADAKGLSLRLCRELRLPIGCYHRRRCLELQEHFQKNRNISLLIDEGQYLTSDGFNFLRDLHDLSDPDGERCLPILLAGDENLYKLIVRTRAGEKSPIAPQLTRRLYPVLNLAAEGVTDGGCDLFSVEDVLRVLRNERVRLVDDQAAKWLASLANTPGWGSLGFAMSILAMAVDIAEAKPIGVSDLRRALTMAVGPRAVKSVDDQAGGRLLRVG